GEFSESADHRRGRRREPSLGGHPQYTTNKPPRDRHAATDQRPGRSRRRTVWAWRRRYASSGAAEELRGAGGKMKQAASAFFPRKFTQLCSPWLNILSRQRRTLKTSNRSPSKTICFTAFCPLPHSRFRYARTSIQRISPSDVRTTSIT